MAIARKCQLYLDETPYLHLISRVIRRSWLCGIVPVSGKGFEHRRDWVAERLQS